MGSRHRTVGSLAPFLRFPWPCPPRRPWAGWSCSCHEVGQRSLCLLTASWGWASCPHGLGKAPRSRSDHSLRLCRPELATWLLLSQALGGRDCFSNTFNYDPQSVPTHVRTCAYMQLTAKFHSSGWSPPPGRTCMGRDRRLVTLDARATFHIKRRGHCLAGACGGEAGIHSASVGWHVLPATLSPSWGGGGERGKPVGALVLSRTQGKVPKESVHCWVCRVPEQGQGVGRQPHSSRGHRHTRAPDSAAGTAWASLCAGHMHFGLFLLVFVFY